MTTTTFQTPPIPSEPSPSHIPSRRSDEGSHDQVTQENSTLDIESSTPPTTQPDIEHQPVIDDPRLWSNAFKW